jgi:putative transcriptional regulator
MDDDEEPLYDDDNPEWTPGNTRTLTDSERLRLARMRLGLSQAALAILLRVPVASIRNWEQGRTKPDGPARTLIALLHHDPKGMRARLERSAA